MEMMPFLRHFTARHFLTSKTKLLFNMTEFFSSTMIPVMLILISYSFLLSDIHTYRTKTYLPQTVGQTSFRHDYVPLYASGGKYRYLVPIFFICVYGESLKDLPKCVIIKR